MNIKGKYIKLILKFRNAFRGITNSFKTQKSFRIHVIFAVIIYIVGIICSLDAIEWILTNTAILFVIVSELFNTSVEYVCDYIQPRYNKTIKLIKDISAGAVLIAVINAIITGYLVFMPYIIGVISV